MQTVFFSVKKSKESLAPSRPTPEAFMPPKGMFNSRTSQQLHHTVPACRKK